MNPSRSNRASATVEQPRIDDASTRTTQELRFTVRVCMPYIEHTRGYRTTDTWDANSKWRCDFGTHCLDYWCLSCPDGVLRGGPACKRTREQYHEKYRLDSCGRVPAKILNLQSIAKTVEIVRALTGANCPKPPLPGTRSRSLKLRSESLQRLQSCLDKARSFHDFTGTAASAAKYCAHEDTGT